MLTEEDYEAIRKIAYNENISQAEVIRRAIAAFAQQPTENPADMISEIHTPIPVEELPKTCEISMFDVATRCKKVATQKWTAPEGWALAGHEFALCDTHHKQVTKV